MSQPKNDGETIAVTTYGPNPFNVTPIEINQHIASYLQDDKHLEAFRRSCRSANDAINSDGLSFWRRRFLAVFEKPLDCQNNIQYKLSYKKRKSYLRQTVRFKRGTTNLEVFCLDILRDLIIEAWSAPAQDVTSKEVYSPNIQHLISFLKTNPSLIQANQDYTYVRGTRSEKLRPFNGFLLIIQILAAPALLQPVPPFELHLRFPACQRAAYSYTEETPIFNPTGTIIDMDWLVHQLGFWQYHMTRPQEYTLFNAFSSLTLDNLPHFWKGPLHPANKPRRGNEHNASHSGLGRHWKGSYAFVSRENLDAIRDGRGEECFMQDEFNGESVGCAFQDLTLEIIPAGDARQRWPAVFEQHLHSLRFPRVRVYPPSSGGSPKAKNAIGPGPSGPKTRAQRRSTGSVTDTRSQSFRFEGGGHDVDEDFLADGWLNPLPAQDGIPGWGRMTMMKYFHDDHGGIDYEALWAYEGVVLPGGNIILGRWWSPYSGAGEDMYSGPFILWCVHGEEEGEKKGEKESEKKSENGEGNEGA